MSESEQQAVTVDSRDMWVMGIALLMLIGTIALLVINIVLLGSNQRELQSQAAQFALVQHQLQEQAVEAKTVHRGVCAFRSNLRTEYSNGVKYLRQHPDGAPALGITAAQIQQSIDRQKKAADALAGLDCGSAR